jgi:hypothetical protein
MSLPLLPAPDTHCFDTDTGKDVWSYSEAQVLAFQAATVEACAKFIEDLPCPVEYTRKDASFFDVVSIYCAEALEIGMK